MGKKFFSFESKNLSHITLAMIQSKLTELNVDNGFSEEVVTVFKIRIKEQGEKAFRKWFSELHYQVPDEFSDESVAIKMYDNYSIWIEDEISKLEKETKLTWEKQTEDIKRLDDKARKAQLVIRHRLSDIALDLMN